MNSFVSVTASKLAEAFTFTTVPKQDSGNLTLEKLMEAAKKLDAEIAQYQRSPGKLLTQVFFDPPISMKNGEALEFSWGDIIEVAETQAPEFVEWQPASEGKIKGIFRPPAKPLPEIPMSPPTRMRMIDLGE